METTDIRQTVVRKADQCVLCGLCLEHCPTYRVSHNEAESPRGRISLLRALAADQLQADRHFVRHIDQCTGCMRCATVCPAGVDISTIFDLGKCLQSEYEGTWLRLTKSLVRHALRHRMTAYLGSYFSSLGAALGWSGGLTRAPVGSTYQQQMDTVAKPKQTIVLFTGCSGLAFDRVTIEASIQLLAKLKVQALMPSQHLCCGAIAQHTGAPDQARNQLQETTKILRSLGQYPVVTMATGCGIQLKEYAQQPEKPAPLHHVDIMSYLAELDLPGTCKTTHCDKKVFLHHPCSSSRLGANDVTEQLLRRIPGIQLTISDAGPGCCGAGGINLLTQKKMGDLLVAPIVRQIEQSNCQIVLSANIGCQLQLRRALKKRLAHIAVMHPVTLLNQMIRNA